MSNIFIVGIGYDVHKLEEKQKFILGGVNIPLNKGLVGHSDGDVLFHAITDAILGSLALGDIGSHFPSENDQWKNAESSTFIDHANSLILENGWEVFNVDSTIILQKPKLAEFIPKMVKNVSSILNIHLEHVSIKATTTDYLGFIGDGDGIACMAVVLIRKSIEH